MLVADSHTLNVFGYQSNDNYDPFPVVSYHVNADLMNNRDSAPSIMKEPRSGARMSGLATGEREEILFANFLSDYDPSLIFLVTYCEQRNVTYLKVLKVMN